MTQKQGLPPVWRDPLQAIDAQGTLPVEQFVTFQINQLSTAFERQWTRVMREQAGVSLSQWRILAMLGAGPAPVARLVEAIGIDKALMSRATRDLEAAGLVSVAPTAEAARSLLLALTPKGERLLARMMPRAVARQRHLLSALTAEERRVFYAAMNKLGEATGDWERAHGDA